MNDRNAKKQAFLEEMLAPVGKSQYPKVVLSHGEKPIAHRILATESDRQRSCLKSGLCLGDQSNANRKSCSRQGLLGAAYSLERSAEAGRESPDSDNPS